MAETKNKISAKPDESPHIQIKHVMLFAVLVLLPVFVIGGVGFLKPQKAQAILLPDFGGRITAYVPFIPNPLNPLVPLCPAHIVIVDLVPAGPKVLGLYVLFGARFQYHHSYLFTGANPYFIPPALPIGTSLLGKDIPAPYLTCPFPYPVVPFNPILGIYHVGTALHP